eukprot:TRINITY_DN1551_c0_g1_i1.p1 TRINITY_DN1551_c0_g1~~TRINITY_DN1551_c0_g1_i1.p1  ORF type:complete len:204 (-),score=35.63 TRINITY_DN1551_c0_g1_i1:147-758(-)
METPRLPSVKKVSSNPKLHKKESDSVRFPSLEKKKSIESEEKGKGDDSASEENSSPSNQEKARPKTNHKKLKEVRDPAGIYKFGEREFYFSGLAIRFDEGQDNAAAGSQTDRSHFRKRSEQKAREFARIKQLYDRALSNKQKMSQLLIPFASSPHQLGPRNEAHPPPQSSDLAVDPHELEPINPVLGQEALEQYRRYFSFLST